jgi:hypothetical protein
VSPRRKGGTDPSPAKRVSRPPRVKLIATGQYLLANPLAPMTEAMVRGGGYSPAAAHNSLANGVTRERALKAAVDRLPKSEALSYSATKTAAHRRVHKTISDPSSQNGDQVAIAFMKTAAEHGLEDPAPPSDTGHAEAVAVIKSVYLSACRHARAGRIAPWAAAALGLESSPPSDGGIE